MLRARSALFSISLWDILKVIIYLLNALSKIVVQNIDLLLRDVLEDGSVLLVNDLLLCDHA